MVLTNQEAIEILVRMETNEFDNPIKCDLAIAKAIEALAKDNNVLNNGWISVKDRMPFPKPYKPPKEEI